jgi:hypothetical protein
MMKRQSFKLTLVTRMVQLRRLPAVRRVVSRIYTEGAHPMTDQRKREVRIPIPGTPAFIIQTAEGTTEEEETNNLNLDQKDDKAQQELDTELADSFPASDPPSAAQPQPCPEGKARASDSDKCEDIKKAS